MLAKKHLGRCLSQAKPRTIFSLNNQIACKNIFIII